MIVQNVMTTEMKTVDAGASLDQVSAQMKENDVGFLPVLEDSRVVGVITDRDIVVRGLAEGSDPKTAKAGEVMTQSLSWCRVDTPLEDAARTMMDKKIRRLIVIDENDRPAGVVSLGDLATQIKNDELAGQVLEQICTDAR